MFLFPVGQQSKAEKLFSYEILVQYVFYVHSRIYTNTSPPPPPHVFTLLQIKYILFVGENAAQYRQYKMRQAIWNKNQTIPSRQQPVLHKSPGKGAQ